MSETLSLVGGLLLLHVHVSPPRPSDAAAAARASLVQLAGRLLVPSVYVYRAGNFFASAFTLDETTDLGNYLASLSAFVVTVVALVALCLGSTLVATGLRSRTVALLLAVLNLAFVFVQHPFYRFVSRSGGEWTIDEESIWMPNVVLSKDVLAADVVDDPWEAYDLHRYYFFLGMSTSGALLLLAQVGPGDVALETDEKLLPVTRALD